MSGRGAIVKGLAGGLQFVQKQKTFGRRGTACTLWTTSAGACSKTSRKLG